MYWTIFSILNFLNSFLEHKYPYDWRTKKPTLFRATEQWFASVDGFRQAAMDAINEVNWIPAQVLLFFFFPWGPWFQTLDTH